jgi:propanediol dehydratase small subunit
MDIAIEFNPSAFKHGISEEDMRTAIERFVYNEIMADDAGKHLLLGFDTHANLLEIIYNKIDEQTINIFHAMKCRKAYYSLAEEHIRRQSWQE